jgi:polyphosphate kinase 2 (PPK2 family)
MRSKEHAAAALQQGIDQLVGLQDKLNAQDYWGVLLILQGMDTSGKDGIVKYVMSGVNPHKTARLIRSKRPRMKS